MPPDFRNQVLASLGNVFERCAKDEEMHQAEEWKRSNCTIHSCDYGNPVFKVLQGIPGRGGRCYVGKTAEDRAMRLEDER